MVLRASALHPASDALQASTDPGVSTIALPAIWKTMAYFPYILTLLFLIYGVSAPVPVPLE